MDETVKKITKRMSPKKTERDGRKNVPFFCRTGRENHYGKEFPYGRKISSAFIRDCGTDTVTEIPGQLTNGSLRLFRT